MKAALSLVIIILVISTSDLAAGPVVNRFPDQPLPTCEQAPMTGGAEAKALADLESDEKKLHAEFEGLAIERDEIIGKLNSEELTLQESTRKIAAVDSKMRKIVDRIDEIQLALSCLNPSKR